MAKGNFCCLVYQASLKTSSTVMMKMNRSGSGRSSMPARIIPQSRYPLLLLLTYMLWSNVSQLQSAPGKLLVLRNSLATLLSQFWRVWLVLSLQAHCWTLNLTCTIVVCNAYTRTEHMDQYARRETNTVASCQYCRCGQVWWWACQSDCSHEMLWQLDYCESSLPSLQWLWAS